MCRHLTIFLQFQSVAPSEAPSLGTAIQKLSKSKSPAMKPIPEDKGKHYMDEEMDCSGIDDDINDMLDEALDDSQVTLESGPTPPKVARSMSPGSSGNLTSFELAGSRFSHRKLDFAQCTGLDSGI